MICVSIVNCEREKERSNAQKEAMGSEKEANRQEFEAVILENQEYRYNCQCLFIHIGACE